MQVTLIDDPLVWWQWGFGWRLLPKAEYNKSQRTSAISGATAVAKMLCSPCSVNVGCFYISTEGTFTKSPPIFNRIRGNTHAKAHRRTWKDLLLKHLSDGHRPQFFTYLQDAQRCATACAEPQPSGSYSSERNPRLILTICPFPNKHMVCSQELRGLTPQFLLLFLAWSNYRISWLFAWWRERWVARSAVIPLNLHPAVLTADAGSPLAAFFLWLEKVLFGRWAESSCMQPFTFKQQISV